jgi:DNA-binding transcriptional regulator YhcF (GntR family)
MLHLQVDPHSGVPVYRQVMDQFKYYLASGALKGGDLLPSIRDLAKTLHVNPTTVVKAYTELQHEGAIEIRHGKGVFAAEAAPRMSDRERETALRRLARQLAIEASQMGAPESLVLRLVREERDDLNKETR